MNIWIDAQLPPIVARWIADNFDVEAAALRDLKLRDAQDIKIFETYSSSNKSSLAYILHSFVNRGGASSSSFPG